MSSNENAEILNAKATTSDDLKNTIIPIELYNIVLYILYSLYAQLLTPQLLTHAQLLTVFEQSILRIPMLVTLKHTSNC